MPLYTDLANMMKQGWPSIVQATRVGVSTIVGLFYALKDGIYIVSESILAAVQAIAAGIGGIGVAAGKLLSGDVGGAAKALAEGWEAGKNRIKLAGENIVAQVMVNDKAIKAALGQDGRDVSLAAAKLPPAPKLNDWVPKPDAAKTVAAAAAVPLDDVAKRVMEGKLRVQEDFIAD